MERDSFSPGEVLKILVCLLGLAGCAPAATPLAPGPTATITLQPSPRRAVEESTPTAALATASPTPPPARDLLPFDIVAQMGGTFGALAIDGDTVYLGIGPRLAAVDISDPASPLLLWQSETLPGLVEAIAAQSGRVYLRLGNELWVYDTNDPALPVKTGKFLNVSGDLFAAGNLVYTFAPGGEAGQLVVIDASDPANPVEAGRGEAPANAELAAEGNALYLASGGGAPNAVNAPGRLQVLDPADLGRVLSEVELGGASNFRVAAAKGFVYVVENRHFEKPDLLLVLDLRDPAQPIEIARLEMEIEQTIQRLVATDKTLFLLSRSFPHSGCPTSVYAFDITDPASIPAPLRFEPQSCFNSIAFSAGRLIATSERGLEVFDANDPADLALSGELIPQDGLISVDKVALNQGMGYVVTTAGRNRQQRLRVLDVTGSTPTALNGEGLDLGDAEPSIFEGPEVRGSWLFGINDAFVDISDPASPLWMAGGQGAFFFWPMPALVEDILFTRSLDGMSIVEGLAIVDMSDPANPTLANSLSLEGFEPTGLFATRAHLFVFSYQDFTRLQVFDVSDPLAPVEVGRLEPVVNPPERVEDFVVSGDQIFVAGRMDGLTSSLYVVDISEPAQPVESWRMEMPAPNTITKMVANKDTVYLRLNSGSLMAMNIREGTFPYLAGGFPFPISDLAIDGDLLYLAAGNAGLVVVRVDP